MMLVPTRVGPSAIQGLGLFAAAPLQIGDEVWRFAPGLDLLIPLDGLADLPAVYRAFLDTYAYGSDAFPDRLVVSCDHAKFMNHSADPNVIGWELSSFTSRPVEAGEELTCDYGAVCSGWTGFA